MSKLSGTLTSVRLIENIKQGLDYCEVQIDFDTLKYFGDYTKCLSEFQGKEVYYEVMPDIYKDQEILRVANLTIVYYAQTVPAATMSKLLPEKDYTRAVCNFEIANIQRGEYQNDFIGFVCGYTKGGSSKSTWVDISIVDRESRVFELRKFTNRLDLGEDETIDSLFDALVGLYVRFDITNTPYGYQANVIEPLNITVIIPPEVDIAEQIITEAIAGDTELLEYIKKHDLLNALRSLINYEPGYHLVYIAAEIIMIQAISNISDIYDKQLLIRAAITSRGYLRKSYVDCSKSVLNVNKVLQTTLSKDKELILLLDVLAEENMSSTKKVYLGINRFVKSLMDERRGVKDETDMLVNSIDTIRSVLGWML